MPMKLRTRHLVFLVPLVVFLAVPIWVVAWLARPLAWLTEPERRLALAVTPVTSEDLLRERVRHALRVARLPVYLSALGIVYVVLRMLLDQAAGRMFSGVRVGEMWLLVTVGMVPVVQVGIVLPMMLRQAAEACAAGRRMEPWTSGMIAVLFGAFGSLLFLAIALIPAAEGGSVREVRPLHMLSILMQAATVVALLHWLRQSTADFVAVHLTHVAEVDRPIG